MEHSDLQQILTKCVNAFQTNNLKESGQCDELIIFFDDGTSIEIHGYSEPFDMKLMIEPRNAAL